MNYINTWISVNPPQTFFIFNFNYDTTIGYLVVDCLLCLFQQSIRILNVCAILLLGVVLQCSSKFLVVIAMDIVEAWIDISVRALNGGVKLTCNDLI